MDWNLPTEHSPIDHKTFWQHLAESEQEALRLFLKEQPDA